MTPEQKKKIYDELCLMNQYTGQTDAIDQKALYDYLDAPKPKDKTRGEVSKLNQQIRDKIVSMMQIDTAGAENLKDLLASEKQEAERRHLAEKQKAAEQTKKLNNAKENQKIKEAREKLKERTKQRKAADKARSKVKGNKEYGKASSKSSISGRWAGGVIRTALANNGFGDAEDRKADMVYSDCGTVDTINAPEKQTGINKDVSFRNKNNMYYGHQYIPEKPNGKIVLAFTGSHGPGAKYIDTFADKYIKEGTTVIQFDYRGFGKSCKLDSKGNPKDTQPSEYNMYEDAHAMYDYVKSLGYKPSDIILHGYSLGGAVASRLAADIAQDNQVEVVKREAEGEILPESERLGGLVLHSPMASNYYAFRVQGSEMLGRKLSPIAGFLGWSSGGSLNTVEHMEKLAKYDPNLPVHYIGGKNPNLDFLSPYVTGIHENPKAQFANQSFKFGTQSHEGRIPDDGCLKELATKGRSADLKGAFERIHANEIVNGKLPDNKCHLVADNENGNEINFGVNKDDVSFRRI